MLSKSWSSIFFLAAAIALGCGGKVSVDAPGAAGGGGGSSPTTSSAGGALGTGGAAACPTSGLAPGAPCDVPGLTCVASAYCCEPTATCKDGVWFMPTSEPCAEPCIPCDPYAVLGCNGQSVCVTGNVASMTTYACALNPCPGEPLDCACAEAACNPGGACVGTEPFTVHCVGPTK